MCVCVLTNSPEFGILFLNVTSLLKKNIYEIYNRRDKLDVWLFLLFGQRENCSFVGRNSKHPNG